MKVETRVLISFTGDALALGAHWIYDSDRITREFGRVERFLVLLASLPGLPGSLQYG
ncbi:MAG: hypothetical protein NTW71_14310 [Deltaproteobacteria bacterium]|nr:hypothetical protein [Deltaproteobacteria bacterium]